MKYPYKATERDAIQMIHDYVEKSGKAYDEGKDCYKDLAMAYAMLEDFFEVKALDPKSYM